MQTSPTNLETVKAKFVDWRNTRTKQGKIPDYLWTDILGLIGNYSMGAITKELSLTNHQIKTKMNELANAELLEIKQSQFSQVVVAEPKPDSNNVVTFKPKSDSAHDIEITRTDGAVLKVSAVRHADMQLIIKTFTS